jgi:hypothetical protein
MNTMKMPGFTAEASFYKTRGRYRTGREVNEMNIPGFTAEFAVSMAGRGYREIVNALTDDSRASVFMAAAAVGGTTCELDYTLTVVEDGVPTTTNYYKCTTTVDVGGGGDSGTPFEGEGGGGSGSGGTERPPKEKPPKNTIGEQWLVECQNEGGVLSLCCNKKEDECNKERKECTADNNSIPCQAQRQQCKKRGDRCRAG